jgi:hypothetical protein
MREVIPDPAATTRDTATLAEVASLLHPSPDWL